jgi:hypothetical protein
MHDETDGQSVGIRVMRNEPMPLWRRARGVGRDHIEGFSDGEGWDGSTDQGAAGRAIGWKSDTPAAPDERIADEDRGEDGANRGVLAMAGVGQPGHAQLHGQS